MKTSNDAVSEVVSTLLTLVIVLGVVTAVLLWGLPYLEEMKMRGESQTVFGGFDVMYGTMRGLIIDGYGTKGFSNIVSTNDKASLDIDSQGKKLILMYTFTDEFLNNHKADFNVSGLDDENATFSIEAVEDINDIDEVRIYWLDPGKTTQQFAFETPPYKKIYQDHWCVQSFTPPVDNWNLDEVKIYVMKRGVITSDLNVSIYPDDVGKPNVNSTLAKGVIPAANIPSSFEWIECDIPDIQLSIGSTYYIGANTSGGSFGDGSYNYYKWYIGKDSPYGSVGANVTEDDGDTWNPVSGYDFEYRLNFTENNPPNTPELTLINPPIYSGVSEIFNAFATDPEGHKVSYRIFWGDGELDEWISWVASGTPRSFWHTYAKPGTYTLTLQAKDEYETIYEPDNVTEIYVQTGDYLPEDSYKKESIIVGGSDPRTIDATWPLNGTLRIDLFSSFYRPIGGQGSLPFGRIWVFDLGSITYESPHSMGTQRTIFENGGILTFGPIGNNIKSKPSFFEEDDAIGFRIIQIGKSYTTSAGGSGTYEIGLNMKNSYSREPRFFPIYNFKMQIHDSFEKVEDLWINYFTTSYDFEKIQDRPNTIYYQTNEKSLVLDSSFIEVNIGRIR